MNIHAHFFGDRGRGVVFRSFFVWKARNVRLFMLFGLSQAICRRIGIFHEGENVEGRSFTGSQFMKLSEFEQMDAVRNARYSHSQFKRPAKPLVPNKPISGELVTFTAHLWNMSSVCWAARWCCVVWDCLCLVIWNVVLYNVELRDGVV
jgi:hypothetical protein